jgi:hypothetical protein
VQSAGNPRTSIGRIEDTSTDEAMTLIKGWLQECMESHDQCQIPDASVLPKRVLSISDGQVRLIETDGQVAPYLTLSHCWGRPPFTQMTSRNLDLLKREIPWTWLSKSFQDAIIITHRLGFQYLWIDGLCILQNDKQDWEYHASKMSEIFSSSQLTIAVSRSGGGDKGCFSRHSDRILELQGKSLRKVKNPLLWQSYYLDGRDRDGIPKTFAAQLKTPHGLFKGRTPEEPLLRRAWVFQEQILSPRIIHYASGELYFECKSQVACECRGKSLRSLTTQWETRWRKAHEVLLEAQQPTSTDRERLRRSSRHFEAYRALIETYTELDITNDLDRLPALSGVTFGRQDLYLAGMWGSILLESLHWTAMPRGNINMSRRPVQYRGPSWSWVSVEAPIRHVEVEFSKAIHSPKLFAKIINASCSPEGLDPRGRVSSGYLQIQGPRVDVQVTEIGFRHRDMSAQSFSERSMDMLVTLRSIGPPTGLRTQEELALCTYAMLKNGDNEEHCYLDVPLALCRTNPAEVAVGDTLTCLVISSRTALVLKACGEVPGIYTRVGIFLPKSETWSFGDSGSIVIV